MLAIAQRTIDDPRIEWQQADALDLPFQDNTFDVVVCQFGAMFYPDKVAGHREAYRVLKPGGLYLLSTWCSHAENRWAATVHAKMAEVFPDDPPLFMNKPFSYCSVNAVKADMAEAGFREAGDEIVSHEMEIEDLPKTLRGFLLGSPLGAAIAERGGDVDQISKSLVQDFAAFGGDSPHRSTKTAMFFSARKPI
jgi:SAM-dependent methyltransferase